MTEDSVEVRALIKELQEVLDHQKRYGVGSRGWLRFIPMINTICEEIGVTRKQVHTEVWGGIES